MTEPNCYLGGWLVGPDTPLPDDPKIYFSESDRYLIGCNRIFCKACQQLVRQWPGYELARGPWALSQADHEELFATLDPEQSRLLVKSKEYRVYVCRCWADSIASDWSLGKSYLNWDYWSCAGHPQ